MRREPCISGSYNGAGRIKWNQEILEINGHWFALRRDREILVDSGDGLRKKIRGRVHKVVPSIIRGAHPELELGRIRPVRTCSENDCVNPEHFRVPALKKIAERRKNELLSKRKNTG